MYPKHTLLTTLGALAMRRVARRARRRDIFEKLKC
jgi:hypothetical protein